MKSGSVRAALICLLLAGVTAQAQADSGTIQAATYLRVGPGRQYAVVDELDPGNQVEVKSCTDTWCSVSSRGAAGYIEARLLTWPGIHQPAPEHPAGPDCVVALLNGLPSGGAERFCTK